MFNKIKEIFKSQQIERVGIIKIEDCEIINARLLPDWAKSVIVFIIPYGSNKTNNTDGFAEYARIYDYHKFASSLYEKTVVLMKNETHNNFLGFCDHSPINEKLAAAKCGLGVIGRNSLFIDEKYGSFVFIGSLITDMECNNISVNISACSNCGLCVEACPVKAIESHGINRSKCLSGISQKKTKTNEEKRLLKENNIVWGCDICQNACPYNKTAEVTPISHFNRTRVDHIDKEYITSLSEEEFEKFAFAYKGRATVLNNIDFL